MNQSELSQNNQRSPTGAGNRGNGITFLFKNDDRGTSTYISSENGVSPEEAVETFFSGDSRWNAELSRFETYTGSHGLFWYWLQKGKVVVVITCFQSSGNHFTEKKRIWIEDLGDRPVDAELDRDVRQRIKVAEQSSRVPMYDSSSFLSEDVQEFVQELLDEY